MPALPTGAETVQCTEVQGSARPWAAHPAAGKAAMERHHAPHGGATKDHGGGLPPHGWRRLRRLLARPRLRPIAPSPVIGYAAHGSPVASHRLGGYAMVAPWYSRAA